MGKVGREREAAARPHRVCVCTAVWTACASHTLSLAESAAHFCAVCGPPAFSLFFLVGSGGPHCAPARRQNIPHIRAKRSGVAVPALVPNMGQRALRDSKRGKKK